MHVGPATRTGGSTTPRGAPTVASVDTSPKVRFAEGCVATLSTVLVWVGLWDCIDYYLLPSTGFAKLLAAVAGILLLSATGTLYDEPGDSPDGADVVLHPPFHRPEWRCKLVGRAAYMPFISPCRLHEDLWPLWAGFLFG